MKKTYDELNSDNDVGYLGGVAMQHYCPIRKRHYFAAEVQSMAKYRDGCSTLSIDKLHTLAISSDVPRSGIDR